MTRSSGSSRPRSVRIPPSVPQIDLLTENTMCGVVPLIPLPYHSAAIRPRLSTTNASVWVARSAGEAEVSDLFQRHFEPRRMARSRDVGGRDQPADVAKAPGAERRLAPVRKCHQSVRRRRKFVHQVVCGHLGLPLIVSFCTANACGKPITFQRGVNPDVAFIDAAYSCKGIPFAGKKIDSSGNKKALLPRRHSYEQSVLPHCREATKLRPRCLMRVTTTIIRNH